MGIRRIVVRASVLFAVAGAFSVSCGIASARVAHPFITSFGSFSNVQGVAADGAGNLYVYDGGTGEVLKFDSTGKPVNFTSTGTNAITGVGFVGGVEGEIAVDSSSGPAKGDIYIAHATSNIGIYNAAGEKIGELTEEAGDPWGEACGVAVDSSGNVYVGLYFEHVNKYAPSASPATDADYVSSMAGLAGVCNVAADSTGNVYSDRWSVGPVTRYEPSQFGSLAATGSIVDENGRTIAVDPANDELYVDEGGQIAQFGSHGEPFETPVATFAGSGEGAISGSVGLAVNPSNHDIYASDGKGKISVFGPGVMLPTVTVGSPSKLTPAEATLNGSVNPEGVTVTSCQFEYGTGADYDHSVPCPTNPGSGNAPVAETAVISGLEVGVLYHYRLTASNANGPSDSGDQTFVTRIVWPETGTGLPDGRVYEEVSPPNKSGNQVRTYGDGSFVSQDGNSIMYSATGAFGENATNGSTFPMFVSVRTAHGWVARSAMPIAPVGQESEEENVAVGTLPTLMVPSADLSHLLFATWGEFPYVGPPDKRRLGNNIFLEGHDPSVEADWVGRSHIEGFPGGAKPTSTLLSVAGASPDLKTIYFFYESELLPGASGLYEYSEGVLSDAGVLGDGETGQGVAAPAASHELFQTSPAGLDGQVSADGSRLFFTREDSTGTLELYVHITAPDGTQSSVLLSRSELPGHVGEPAAHGPLAVPSTEEDGGLAGHPDHKQQEDPPSYVFASPDGSHAFFQSTDRLTEAAPNDSTAKIYEFDLATGTLVYVPGLTGSIVTVSNDGSSLVFENTATKPFRLERWTAGPDGGSVAPIAQLPSVSPNACNAVLCVGPAYTSSDGKVVVFASESPIPGFNDGGSHYQLSEPEDGEQSEGSPLPNIQIFRYDAEDDKLSCVSCPPAGVVPSSDSILSRLAFNSNILGETNTQEVITPGRAISPDGSRIFFETRQALLLQDTNGTSDVYEWSNGGIHLISSGHSSAPSHFDGISESGDDAFFMTTEAIAPGDTDGGYDVYDARVPRPGDNPPPEAVPCTGAVCQGPPSVPQLLGQPASEAFSGTGDATPVTPSHVKVKSLTRAQKLARALKVCRRDRSVRKRKRCEKQARSKYRAISARQVTGLERHNNGRGK